MPNWGRRTLHLRRGKAEARSLADLDINAKDSEQFRQNTELPFNAVTRVSGTNVIVDAS